MFWWRCGPGEAGARDFAFPPQPDLLNPTTTQDILACNVSRRAESLHDFVPCNTIAFTALNDLRAPLTIRYLDMRAS